MKNIYLVHPLAPSSLTSRPKVNIYLEQFCATFTKLRFGNQAISQSGLPYIHFPPPALCISSLALLCASLLFVFVLCLCLTNTIFSCICVCICSCICINFPGPALCPLLRASLTFPTTHEPPAMPTRLLAGHKRIYAA